MRISGSFVPTVMVTGRSGTWCPAGAGIMAAAFPVPMRISLGVNRDGGRQGN
jgi:hypothetical protein